MKLALFNLCHHLTYTCQAKGSFYLDPSVCSTDGHLSCGTRYETFQQVNSSYCVDDAGRQPHFQHCGIAIYGRYQMNAALHMIGQHFNVTSFWEGRSPYGQLGDWASRPQRRDMA